MEAKDWISSVLSFLALAVAVYTFWAANIHEIHDFQAVVLDDGVLLINAGNRTEILYLARYRYSLPGQTHQLGLPTASVVLKPGDAQKIGPEPLDTSQLDARYQVNRNTSFDFLIVNTRSGNKSDKQFLETDLGVGVKRGSGAVPGPNDRSRADLYQGTPVE